MKDKKLKKVKRVLREYKSIINQLKKPSKKEYWLMIKINLTIILLIGFVGYLFFLLFKVLIKNLLY
ncbi:MAG TPA: protein translocase SEC61 complex subunit gamma [Nautiliaceae bacterium]|nr:protein translocase SEC61 complex subunit gamma [Nautiliaceae bacterium]